MKSDTSSNQTLAELAKLRNYYKLKKALNIGKFWRRKQRTRLKSQSQIQHLNSIILGEDNILYPTASKDIVTNGALYRGDALREMRWIMKHYCKPGTLTIDVGTNVGYLSAFMAQCVGAEGEVWCFEPNAGLNQHIHDIFWLNQWQHYQLFNVALSDNTGEVPFRVDPNNHSISKIDSSTNQQRVACQTLDSYLGQVSKPVTLIKIDVEGHEPAVLRGAITFLKSHRPALVFESGLHDKASTTAIDDCLAEANYRLVGIIREWGLEPIDSIAALPQSQRHVNCLALPKI